MLRSCNRRKHCMARRFHLVLCVILPSCLGCLHHNVIRDERDRYFLTQPSPDVPPPVEILPTPANCPQLPALGEPLDFQADRSQNPDATISLHEAVRMALRQSNVVRVTEGQSVRASVDTFYDIVAAEARVESELAEFDTTFESLLVGRNINRPPDSFFGPGLLQPQERDELSIDAGFRKKLRSGGKAGVAYLPDPGYLFIPDPDPSNFNPRLVGALDFTFEQPLWQNAGPAVVTAPIQISQLSAQQSAWEFKRSVMSAVADVGTAYWNLYAARIAAEATREVIPLLEEIVRLQEASFKTEWVIKADVAKAYAQLHRFQQDYVALQLEVVEQELRLRSLMGAAVDDGTALKPSSEPLKRRLELPSAVVFDTALTNQPEIVQKRIDVQIRKAEVLLAKNLLKPTLDFVALYRLNGLGDNLGDALDQLASLEFVDWNLGARFSVPLGRRQAASQTIAAEQRLLKDMRLLEQLEFSLYQDLAAILQRMEYSFREYELAEKRLAASKEWAEGARLRYENPNLDTTDAGFLVGFLDDYFLALRSQTDAAAVSADALASYNIELIRLEQTKGTILSFFAVDYLRDPCLQATRLATPDPAQILPPPPIEPQADDSVPATPPAAAAGLPLPSDGSRMTGPVTSIAQAQHLVAPPTVPTGFPILERRPLPDDEAVGSFDIHAATMAPFAPAEPNAAESDGDRPQDRSARDHGTPSAIVDSPSDRDPLPFFPTTIAVPQPFLGAAGANAANATPPSRLP